MLAVVAAELAERMSADASTASKSDPFTRANSLTNTSSFQRESGTPEMNHAEPLSARNMPYFLSARRITCTGAEKPLMSKLPRSRMRSPIGGYCVALRLEA